SPTIGTQSIRGDTSVSYALTRKIVATVLGFAVRDLQTDVSRGLLGAELSMPTMFGRFGGAAAGWSEEVGWVGGRAPYLQATLQPWRSLRALARVGYVDEAYENGARTRELSLMVHLDYAFARWLS